MRVTRGLWIAACAASAALFGPAANASCLPQRESTKISLPDFDSPAELELPAQGVPMRGVLVLFPGSDVADMDGAIEGRRGAIISRPMRQVADRLACEGFASLRYNKRYVTGPTQVDRAKFDALNGSDFVADGRTALAVVRSRPNFARLPLGLVGWSEGTTTAMAVAAAERLVRAVVLMAPVVESPAKVAQAQYGRIGRPYLMRYATDGALDADAVARAGAGPGGDLTQIFVRMFRGFRPGETINLLLDTNHDGRISFAEADPVIASWYADGPGSGLGMSSSARSSKGVSDAFPGTRFRILMLQGLADSMIDPQAARTFAARFDARRTVRLFAYPGLGHSLGAAASAQEDTLSPMAKPLDDMATWLRDALRP